MGFKQIAFLFIGQTPRPDTMEEMCAYLPAFRIREYGALDDMSDDCIEKMYAPESPEELLISRLRDGRSVRISERKLVSCLQRKLEQAADEGAHLCVLMCTGSFPGLQCRVPLVTMDQVFHEKLELAPQMRTIGLIVPMAQQQEQFARQYGHLEKAVYTAWASPYGASEDIVDAALTLKMQGADCICLDCMGYSREQARQVEMVVKLPVYTPRQETVKYILNWFEIWKGKE